MDASKTRKRSNEQMSNPFLDTSANYLWPKSGFDRASSNSRLHVTDARVARLLLVLHELDHSVAGLGQLPQSELTELVSSALLACGFVNGADARSAIAAVLEMIEMPDPGAASC
jgi:hypothetical protein